MDNFQGGVDDLDVRGSLQGITCACMICYIPKNIFEEYHLASFRNSMGSKRLVEMLTQNLISIPKDEGIVTYNIHVKTMQIIKAHKTS